MGGSGSGRHWHWNTKNTIDDYRSIDVRRWAREGLLTPGRCFGWQWFIEGEKVASIQVQAAHGQVHLIYRSRDYGDEWESLDYPVRLLFNHVTTAATETGSPALRVDAGDG